MVSPSWPASKVASKPFVLWPKLGRPFINCIAISHAAIAACTNGDKVVKSRLTTLALRNVMTAFIVEHINPIGTPGNTAFAFEAIAHCSDPNLLCQCFGDLLLLVRLCWKITELHFHDPDFPLYTRLPTAGPRPTTACLALPASAPFHWAIPILYAFIKTCEGSDRVCFDHFILFTFFP